MELCLTAIVKNEAPIIARMLESVRPFISYYSIADTGSTDGTQDIIRSTMRGVPGVLFEDKWEDFATNRNLALSRAKGDYVITLDADEILWRTGNVWPESDRTGIKINIAGTEHWSPRLLKNDGLWRWVGKVHEMPDEHDGPYTNGLTDYFEIEAIGDGHQTTSQTREQKAQHLLELLLAEPRTPRTIFYLARTYYELEQYEKAIELFEEHVKTDAWDEEKYISLYQIAAALQMLGRASAQAWARAYEFRPTRGEALEQLALMVQSEIEHFQPGYDTLFCDPNINEKLKHVWRMK